MQSFPFAFYNKLFINRLTFINTRKVVQNGNRMIIIRNFATEKQQTNKSKIYLKNDTDSSEA